DLSLLGRLYLIGVEKTAQDAGDPLDLALFAPDQVAHASHDDLARVDVVRLLSSHLQLAPRRSTHSCADVQAVSAGCRRSGYQQLSDRRPDLHDAWQVYPRNGRQSFHPVPTIMPESGSPGKLPEAAARSWPI